MTLLAELFDFFLAISGISVCGRKIDRKIALSEIALGLARLKSSALRRPKLTVEWEVWSGRSIARTRAGFNTHVGADL
jgi:hypothetical protein